MRHFPHLSLPRLAKVPREAFVTPGSERAAYENRPLPIGHGQTISQPFIVALMTELLDLRADDNVLEVGTGSGYQAAVLAEIAGRVCSIEVIPELAARAATALAAKATATSSCALGTAASDGRSVRRSTRSS